MKRYSPEHQDEISEDAQLDFSKDIAREKIISLAAIAATALIVIGTILLIKSLVFKKGVETEHDKGKPTVSSTSPTTNTTTEAAKAAIERKSLSDLDKYLSDKVRVVNAKTGTNQTVASVQVQSQIAPLNTALNPWNWNIPASQLDAWKQGPYGQYIVAGATVGQSADGQVVIITYDSSGQISSIVIIPNADMLTPTNNTGGQAPGSTTTPSGTTDPASTSTTNSTQNSSPGTD